MLTVRVLSSHGRQLNASWLVAEHSSPNVPLLRPILSLRELAEKEPLGVDISDFGDEWCAGFLRGQVNALDEVCWKLRTHMDSALLTHGVGEMTELLAVIIAEIEGA